MLFFALGLVFSGAADLASGAIPPPPKPAYRPAPKLAPKPAPKPVAKTRLAPKPTLKPAPKPAPKPRPVVRPKPPAKPIARSARKPVLPRQSPPRMRNGIPHRSTMAKRWTRFKRTKITAGRLGSKMTSSMHRGSALIRGQRERAKFPVSISDRPYYLKGGGGKGGGDSGGHSAGPRTSKLSARWGKHADQTGRPQARSVHLKRPLTPGQQKGRLKIQGGSQHLIARSGGKTPRGTTRRQALRAQKVALGVPRSQQPSKSWTIHDPARLRGAGVRDHNPRNQGRIYEYKIPIPGGSSKKVYIIDHHRDRAHGGIGHIHQGIPKPGSLDVKPGGRYSKVGETVPYDRR
ncbi:MAG TPA: hypothetical protein DIW77_05175 [Chromatiaceae bacterium]|nr:hypothetical protein [Chromatiaceae bacterium]